MNSINTAVIKLLNKRKIKYRLLLHKNPAYTVESAARERGVDKSILIKSILLVNSVNEYIMVCMRGNTELNSKALRKVLPSGWRRFRFATEREILEVTGYEIGAVNPVGISDDICIYFDVKIKGLEKVTISSGDPMAGIEMLSIDLINLVKPEFVEIS